MTTYSIIDCDTHITEPPDVWTARVPRRYLDSVPQVRRDEDGKDIWGNELAGMGYDDVTMTIEGRGIQILTTVVRRSS